MSWQHLADVVSDSEPGETHVIKQRSDGTLGCSCLSYRFKRGVKTCKHLEAFRLSLRSDVAGAIVPVNYKENGVPAEYTLVRKKYQTTERKETFTIRRAITFGGSQTIGGQS